MINLTDSARKELDGYFADKEKSPVRVYMAAGGWRGPRLALALDEPDKDDDTFDVNGYTFCVNKELLTTIGGASVDLTYMGFTVEPNIPLEGGGGCGGSCSSGTCGS